MFVIFTYIAENVMLNSTS